MRLLERRGPRWAALAPILSGATMLLILIRGEGGFLAPVAALLLVVGACLAVFLLWPGPRAGWTFRDVQAQVRGRREWRWAFGLMDVGLVLLLAALLVALVSDDAPPTSLVWVLVYAGMGLVAAGIFAFVLGLTRELRTTKR